MGDQVQYIGARYVPKFAEPLEWQAGTQYENLMIVTYNNNTYTSKKPVPAGINPSNSEYWALTGNFNAQLTQVQEDVNALDGRVETNETNISTLQKGAVTVTQEIEEINQQIETMSTELDELEGRVNDLNTVRNRSFIFIGDSYNREEHNGGWSKYIIENLGLSIGQNAFTIGTSGAGFGVTPSYMEGIEEMITQVSQTGKMDNISDVVIAGGANDWKASDVEIAAGMTNCITKIKQQFRNAKVWIIACGWSYENDDIRNGLVNAYNSYAIHGKDATVVELYTLLLDPHFLEEDMVHPTQSGMEKLASLIQNTLMGGNYQNIKYTDLSTYFISNVGAEFYLYGDVTPCGYHVYKSNDLGLRFDDTPITISHGEGTIIASHTGKDNNNLFMRKAVIPCSVMYAIKGAKFYNGRGLLTIKKREGEMMWDMYLSSESIFVDDYPVKDVVGLYIQFDCWLDITKN